MTTTNKDSSMFSHDKFRMDDKGRRFRACKWCGEKISNLEHGRTVFCKPEHKTHWHHEKNRRISLGMQ